MSSFNVSGSAIDECDRLRDEVVRLRADLDGWRNDHDQVCQSLREAATERDLLKASLDESCAMATDLTGQLDALRDTCNRLQDRDAYRDWCYRLKAELRRVENQRDMFLAMAAYWFDRRFPGVTMPIGAAVNVVFKLSNLSPGGMIKSGMRMADALRVEGFRRHVTRCYASGEFNPNTKGE